ncbi:hypothetical protein [Microcoleus sp. CAWBG640]
MSKFPSPHRLKINVNFPLLAIAIRRQHRRSGATGNHSSRSAA